MDLDKIFSVFSNSEDLDGVNTQVYIDFTNTPVYWIGMYKKTILNRANFREKTQQILRGVGLDEIEVQDADKAGEYIAYERAYNYIKNIDINNESHIKDLKRYADIYFECTLQLGIGFYEEYEEYEKCAFLRDIFNTLKSFREQLG